MSPIDCAADEDKFFDFIWKKEVYVSMPAHISEVGCSRRQFVLYTKGQGSIHYECDESTWLIKFCIEFRTKLDP